ncbi:MAG: DUF4346 domain-containing protein [Chloroflexi bacterium]|nr:DUF4346 domain-containing protein [Chloroflexota bacterium]
MTQGLAWEPAAEQELERRISMMGMDGDRAQQMRSRVEAIARERGGEAVTVADLDEARNRAMGGGSPRTAPAPSTGQLEWDRDLVQTLEKMSIFQRERIRERLVETVTAAGRDRVTAQDLTDMRAAMRGMGGGRATEEPLPTYDWPVLAGAYEVIDEDAPVAVCTLASETLIEELGKPSGVGIIGRAFTENLGAEKVAINVVANPALRVLVLCGTESRHHVGQTLKALHESGLDGDGRVVGSEGPQPLLKNFPAEAQAIFREKLTIVDLIEEGDSTVILEAIAEAAAAAEGPWSAAWRPEASEQAVGSAQAPAMARPEDAAGFVLVSIGPRRDRLFLEHYSNDAELRHVISGRTADEICKEAVAVGALSELSHATYIGREALKAELALRYGLEYEQDRPITLATG